MDDGMMDELREMIGDEPEALLGMLDQFPLPPSDKLRMVMKMLPPERDAFELAATMVSGFSSRCWVRRIFETMAPMTIEEVDSQAAEGIEDPVDRAAFMRMPTQQRRREWLTSVVEGMQNMEEEGGGLIVGDGSDEDDSEEEEDEPPEAEPQAEGTPGRTCSGALAWVRMQLQGEGLGLIMLERPYEPDAAPESITRASVLAKKHLLVCDDTAERALQIYKRGMRLIENWMGGGTSLGNTLWSRFFLPSAAAAAEYFDERRTMPTRAFGELLGVLLLGRADDGWIHDQEIYCEFDEFAHFFDSLSASWKEVLSRPDGDIGLEAPCNAGPDELRTAGAPPRGYYRSTLMEMLRAWETEVNESLEKFDDFAEDNVARLSIEIDERLLKARTEHAYGGYGRHRPPTHEAGSSSSGAAEAVSEAAPVAPAEGGSRGDSPKRKKKKKNEGVEATYAY